MIGISYMEKTHIVDERKLNLLEIIPYTKNGHVIPDWWKDITLDGKNAFILLPIPHSKMEGWRETNLSPFFNPQRKWTVDIKKQVHREHIPEIINKYFSAHILWENGVVTMDENLIDLPDKIIVSDFKEILASEHEELLKSNLERDKEPQHIFEALSEMLFYNGIFIYLPKGIVIDEPMNIYIMSSADRQDTIDIPWVLIILDDNAQASITLNYITHNTESASVWVNAKTKIVLGKNAHLNVLENIQGTEKTLRFHSISAGLDKDSSLNYNSLHLSGRFLRSEINAEIQGENVQCHINGLTLNEKNHFSETQQQIQHLKGQSVSRIHWRGLGREQSKTVYRGKIYIAPDAQKSDSIQQFKGLSLSDGAVIDAKPQLEIYADDVRCTHGATVGPPSAELIYYFQSRGIPPVKARSLLVRGFANQVLADIPFPNTKEFISPYLIMSL